MPRAKEGGAVDTMFFWHKRLSLPGKHLAAAIAFFVFGILIIPWLPSKTTLLRRLAILPALVCLALWISIILTPNHRNDVVVVGDAAVLRTADSRGAPAARSAPLPAGSEGEVTERRGSWVRVSLAGSFSGWLPKSSVAFVVP